MQDTQDTLRDLARQQEQALRAEAQVAAAAYIRRTQTGPDDAPDLLLAMLGLDGTNTPPVGVCPFCRSPKRLDRKGCQRIACQQEVARLTRALEESDD